MSKEEKELYRRCDEILHYVWDPIGVKGIPGARDEYYGYLPQVFKLVLNDANKVKIANHLSEIERISMGLTPETVQNEKVSETLLEWKEWIWEKQN